MILVAWPQEIRTTNVPVYNPDILLLGGNIYLQLEAQDNFNSTVPKLYVTSTEYNTKPTFTQHISI
jgi:hypothetical protein